MKYWELEERRSNVKDGRFKYCLRYLESLHMIANDMTSSTLDAFKQADINTNLFDKTPDYRQF